MAWTDERVAEMRKLWGEGHSASYIAAQLRNVSRNAVIGKLHRIGCTRAFGDGNEEARQRNKAAKARTVRRRTYTAAPGTPRPSNQTKIRDEDRQAIHEMAPVRLPSGELVSVLTLTASLCKYPCGDPKHNSFAFCGRPSLAGRRYCVDHTRLAYVPEEKKARRA